MKHNIHTQCLDHNRFLVLGVVWTIIANSSAQKKNFKKIHIILHLISRSFAQTLRFRCYGTTYHFSFLVGPPNNFRLLPAGKYRFSFTNKYGLQTKISVRTHASITPTHSQHDFCEQVLRSVSAPRL